MGLGVQGGLGVQVRITFSCVGLEASMLAIWGGDGGGSRRSTFTAFPGTTEQRSGMLSEASEENPRTQTQGRHLEGEVRACRLISFNPNRIASGHQKG